MPVEMTYRLAHAAGWDAGNRSMKEGGRTHWNADDANAAAAEFRRLWPVVVTGPENSPHEPEPLRP